MSQKVVVVGYCASGKSSVVEALRDRGVDAHAVAQEHSAIDDLWNHPDPDRVVFLDVTIEEIRQRRQNPAWPEWIYDLQKARLSAARARADLVINTAELSVAEIIPRVIDMLESD